MILDKIQKTNVVGLQAASAAKKTYWLSNDGRRRHTLKLSRATTPTNGFQARARHERPPVKVGGAASSAAVSQLLSIGRRPIDDGNLKLGFLMEPWWQKAPNSNGKSS